MDGRPSRASPFPSKIRPTRESPTGMRRTSRSSQTVVRSGESPMVPSKTWTMEISPWIWRICPVLAPSGVSTVTSSP
ncbi:hypothetical protein MASR2M17_00840 [Aminivibrio sp.]